MPVPEPRVAIVLHAYQPPSIPDAEVEHVVRNTYVPVLALHRRLGMPLTLNMQGCLLQRLARLTPDALGDIRDLLDAGLLEMTASAHYHPILPLLPRASRMQQIARNSDTIRRHLGVVPLGFWPPELAWSPALDYEVALQGTRWVIIDGSCLVRAWSREEEMTGEIPPAYLPAELMRPYRLAGQCNLTLVARHHALSRQLFEATTLFDMADVEAWVEAFRCEAQGLVCLAADAECISHGALAGYERALEGIAERTTLTTPTVALEGSTAEEPVSLPIWTWHGSLDRWVRGEAERSYLRELDDARQRFCTWATVADDKELVAQAEDRLMQAESSCWLYWQSPSSFLAEGFARIHDVHRIIDGA
jgi:alpha-amylase/alpha-mannosidase (GH57 family)